MFESLYGDRVRASDAAWVQGLSAAARMGIVDDLFLTVRAARRDAGDWPRVDDLAWQETLSDRIKQVELFRRFDEASRGTGPVANAR